jgi:hypothetical protein
MSFPTSPTNGQQASINGITYTYSSALTAWTVSTSVSNSFVSISVAGNVNSGNLLATGTVSVTGNVQGANVNGTTVSATGNVIGGNVTTTGLTKTDTFSVTGNVIGNLLPSANITYDLGSSTQRWRDLWLSGTTIQLGAASISASGDSVSLGAGNISGNYVFGNGSQLTGIAVFVTAVAYPGIATAADPAGSQTITVTGTGFNSGITAYINSTSCATTYGNSTSLTFVTPATAAGTYNVSLYNTDGTSGTKPGGIVFSPIPVWVTASGALTGAFTNFSYSTSVSATGDGITYSVTTGSLPTGLSLNASTGAITGTPTVEATSTFSITATDAQNQGVARSFSIAVVTAVSVDYLVVAGGGGGSDYGAGGAGGYLTASGSSALPGTTYTVTVGAGGAGAATGTAGSNSVFGAITAIGGGRGGKANAGAGTSGGSGGGGGYNSGAGGSGTAGPPIQGYNGGAGFAAVGPYMGGGGGGSSAVGDPGISTKGGDGGAGTASSITGSSVTYAGGGGGGGYTGSPAASGGAGGGGAGGISGSSAGAGTANTGGGGGGAGNTDSSGGTGGSGVVILRFLSTVTPAGTTGSPTITTDGSYSVYKFTASGSITF